MAYRLINPYTIYIGSFSCVVALYFLGWSQYYPPIGWKLLLFLIATICIALFLASKQYYKQDSISIEPAITLRTAIIVTILLFVTWTAEFVHEGGMPLILILLGRPFNYRTFGIPSLHVFAVTFSSFFTCYLFHVYLISRNKIILILSLVNLSASLLIMNRGMLLMNLSTMLFIFLSIQKAAVKFSATTFFKVTTIMAILFYGFGALGTIRVSHGLGRFYEPHLVYEVGNATDSFKKSIVPSEFFWSYLYITSPLANLQHNISNSNPVITKENFFQLINNEFLPNAASKRINALLKVEKKENLQIADNLNASTVFSGSFTYWGWMGMTAMFIFLMILPLTIRIPFINQTPYYITFFSLLNTLYLFLIFDNMISFTGLSFQLVYPILFGLIKKKE
jgi:hypothetical protein